MTDWLGETTFEVDLLHELKSATDHKGNTVTYDYDILGEKHEIEICDIDNNYNLSCDFTLFV